MKKLVSFGCSFTAHSHNNENLERRNRVVYGDAKPHYEEIVPGVPNETSYTFETAYNLNTTYENFGDGGSGVRSAIYKALYYAKTNPIIDIYFIIGVSFFSRFDFVTPFRGSWGGINAVRNPYPKFPKEDYARYYDEKSVEYEILTLIEMTSLYLNEKKIPHVFINTCNNRYSIQRICNTFMFPDNNEYWKDHIISYDDTYCGEHPNYNDHVRLGKLLANYLKPLI